MHAQPNNSFQQPSFDGKERPSSIWRCRKILLATAGALMVAITGCDQGPQVGRVTGEIRYNGRPMKGIEISLDPVEAGRSSKALTNSSGSYELQYTRREKGALVGIHQVRLVWPVHSERDLKKRRKFPIPASYNTTSSQTYEVKTGSNTFDMDIVAK